MKLILILLSLGINHISTGFDALRQFSWFDQYLHWLEQRLASYGIWNSTIGVLLPVLPVIFLVLLLLWLLNGLWFVLGLVFSLLVLIVCFDREQLIEDLEDCLDGCRENDIHSLEAAASRFTEDFSHQSSGQVALFRGIFIQHQSKVLGVLFWFVLLGVMGAILYRLTHYIYDRRADIHGGFADSVRQLHYLLNWPVTRVSILSYALVGSLMDTLETWRDNEIQEQTRDDELLSDCALAAMQYQEDANIDTANWLLELQGLMNRALVLWLVVVALVTISGWIA